MIHTCSLACKVLTSGLTYCIVSYIPKPAVTKPPGLLMYKEISFFGSSDSKNNNCAVTNDAIASLSGPTAKTILSFNNLGKYLMLSHSAGCSTTMG